MNKRPGWVTFFAVLQFIEAMRVSFLAIGAFKSGDLGFGILLIVLAGSSIPIGFGLLRLKNWARVVLLIKSIPELFLVPIGTVIAGITIYYFTRRKSKSYFIYSKKTLSKQFSKAWKDFCLPKRMAKHSALIKGLIALEKNNRKKARKIWEGLQKHFPQDYRITHSLALLNYWETVSAKNPKGPTQEVIGKNIGNWVMLLNSVSADLDIPRYHRSNIPSL